ncbi:HNH endonuclease [Exiguobacterium sp. AM39-5BH]|nr:HNH endonuclease [Exiguobacterium sp. AM39-5BH]
MSGLGKLKEEHLALSSGIGLAGFAISNFYESIEMAFAEFEDEIIDSIVKPNKTSAIHWYLSHFQDISRQIHDLRDVEDRLEYCLDFIVRILKEANLDPKLPVPDFDNCTEDWHEECECKEMFDKWERYVNHNAGEIDDLIIHSAFQVIFLDRKFLHDFHLALSEFIKYNMSDIQKKYPDCVTSKGRINRFYFPKWLTNAVFYRDKGTCTICRCDLSNLIRSQNTVHIDHIVPLDVFGSNDASNFQLLCEACNTSKGARATTTSSINVPFWNH